MAAPKLKKCRGLYTAGNRYDVPEGALVQANNILIVKDGVIQPRWSLAVDGSTMVTGNVSHWHRTAELNGVLWFAGRDTSASTLRIGYGNPGSSFAGVTALSQTEDFPDTAANFTASTTPWFDVEFLKLGNLLYANTFRGLLRIESSSVQRLAGSYPCAVSCFPRPIATTASRTSNVTTVTTTFAHGYVSGITVTTTGADGAAAKVITVTSTTTFTYADVGADGVLTVTSVSAHQFVGSSGFITTNERVAYRAVLTEYDTNGNEYIGESSGRVVVTNAAPFVGTAATKNVQLAVLFPPALLAANTKVELYRSRIAASAEPSDEMGLVYSKFLTSDDVANGFVWFNDINPDSQIRKALFINETQDGAKQNHGRPAGAKTSAVWGKRLVQANTFDFPQVAMQLLSTDSAAGGLAAADEVTLDYDNNLLLTAVASGSPFTTGRKFNVYTGGTASTDVKHTVHSLLDSLNWCQGSAGTPVTPLATWVGVYTSAPSDWPGSFSIQRTAADQYEATSTTAKSRTVSARTGGTSNRACFAPKLNELKGITDATRAANVTTITTSANHNFEVGEYVILYSSWTSQTQASIAGTAVEGKITSKTASTIVFANTGTNGSTSSGVVSLLYRPQLQANRQKNALRVSKQSSTVGNQPEAFPAFNTVAVGAPNANILKCVPCKDSLMVFKEDGLFRVTSAGAFGESLSAELVDPNAVLWAKDTAVTINGYVMAWLTKGVAIIGESGVVKYVSKDRIEDKLKPANALGYLTPYQLERFPFTRRAFAVADEVNGLYELRINMETSPSAPYSSTVNLTYNIHNDTWVEDDLAVVSEVIYNGLRQIQQGTAFYFQESAGIVGGTVLTTSASAFSGYSSTAQTVAFTYTGATPSVGATMFNGDTSETYYVLSAAAGAGVLYVARTTAPTLPASFGFYNPVVSTVEWAPITFNAENQLKLHREVQIMFGVSDALVAETVTRSDLVATTETVVNKLGAVAVSSATIGVDGYKPETKRFSIPTQHRVGQQLNFKMIIRCAFGAWTILGIGVDGSTIGPKVSR